MTDANQLSEKVVAHYEEMQRKIKAWEDGNPPTADEVRRDGAISLDLWQQYTDLLDDIKQEIEEEGVL